MLTEAKPKLERTECACATCQSACENTPGWFRPGEAEKAAKLLGLSMKTFFRRYLGVNWYNAEDGPVFVLAPALVGEKPGKEYPANPKGTCVFFTKDRRCRIHAAKPFGCSHGSICQTGMKESWRDEQVNQTVPLWAKHQDQIVKLLGREPEEDMDFNPFSFLFGL